MPFAFALHQCWLYFALSLQMHNSFEFSVEMRAQLLFEHCFMTLLGTICRATMTIDATTANLHYFCVIYSTSFKVATSTTTTKQTKKSFIHSENRILQMKTVGKLF